MFALVIAAFLHVPTAKASKNFSEWSAPTNLGQVINSQFEEILPHISKDGLSLYFVSNRPGGFGDFDIWVSQRPTRNDAWGPPMNLGPTINTSYNAGPDFLENDDIGIPSLFLGSNRPGGVGGFDIYLSNLLPDGSFGPSFLMTELCSPENDFRPTVRPDGLELFFDSNRPGGIGLRDLYVSTRETVSVPWSTPSNLGPVVNSEFNEEFPALSSDGKTLIFSSDRPGGFGGSDLYLSSRDKHE